MIIRQSTIPFLLAVAVGMGLWFLSSIKTGKREPWDSDFYWALAYPVAVGFSGLMGALFPDRPWRWVLTLFLAQFVAMTIWNGELGNLWPLGMLLLCLISIPGIALAQFAAWVRSRFTHK